MLTDGHRYIYRVLFIAVSQGFYAHYVRLPLAATPSQILKNRKWYPFFSRALGAVDGVHFSAQVPQADTPRYRNRKGFVSQNVLAACGFDMRFHYILAGWEGSAADGLIFADSQAKGFVIPTGWYYLADAGFASCPELLVPYRGVRYHLREQAKAKQR